MAGNKEKNEAQHATEWEVGGSGSPASPLLLSQHGPRRQTGNGFPAAREFKPPLARAGGACTKARRVGECQQSGRRRHATGVGCVRQTPRVGSGNAEEQSCGRGASRTRVASVVGGCWWGGQHGVAQHAQQTLEWQAGAPCVEKYRIAEYQGVGRAGRVGRAATMAHTKTYYRPWQGAWWGQGVARW